MLEHKFRVVVCGFLLMLGSSILMAAQPAEERPLIFVTQDFPPFNYLEEGQVKGAVVELIDLVCKDMQRLCEHQLLPWNRAQSRIRQGVADGIYTIGRNPEREQWLLFSPAILTTEYGFFVHQNNPIQINAPEDIRDYQVGVYGPSNSSRSLQVFRGDKVVGGNTVKDQRQPIFKIYMTPNDEAGFRQLPIGRIDAVYSNRDAGWAMIRKLGLSDIRYSSSQKSLDYYIGFSKQFADRDAVNEFQQSYLKLLRQGAVAQVLAPYKLQPKLSD
ncbi:MAG: transporter substrate-binding domain-containing protein [Motiliproteus sp.]